MEHGTVFGVDIQGVLLKNESKLAKSDIATNCYVIGVYHKAIKICYLGFDLGSQIIHQNIEHP